MTLIIRGVTNRWNPIGKDCLLCRAENSLEIRKLKTADETEVRCSACGSTSYGRRAEDVVYAITHKTSAERRDWECRVTHALDESDEFASEVV